MFTQAGCKAIYDTRSARWYVYRRGTVKVICATEEAARRWIALHFEGASR